MSELVLLILRIGFLVLLWFFVFGVVYSLRADLFGVRVRKLPAEQAAAAPAARPAPAPKPSAPSPGRTPTKLVITSGPKAGLEVPLGTEPMTIGRSSESGLVIRDDYTSSHHARLALHGGAWTIQDLGSTNGTFLAGERISDRPHPIPIGAPIKVGATTFELRA
ncbi:MULTISPECIES: FHA domain-containing protein FhaB/FipA [Microbacterium]|uniref:FHA domain-containing protein FhaB/FipA n=1 Tax=Microbacterium TaxID=33882 RepID=UPI00217D4292|nr:MULTISPECIES: FHA domain-containing protein [Microbacterium]UWF77555.1 FHA domain-containing protein [Microbacterium neungamense]WCM55725.1 FHA domain-containing protein [Microbacterium sp. EF45047]